MRSANPGRQWASLELENDAEDDVQLSPIYDFNSRNRDQWSDWREFAGRRPSRSAVQLVVWAVLSVLTVTFFFLYISERYSSIPGSCSNGEGVKGTGGSGSLFYSETGYEPFKAFEMDQDYRGVKRTQESQKGMVVSDHGACSDMGGEILKRGGNAMDAAVTTTLCIGIRNPFASGIGGGGFILVYDEKGEAKVIDAREVAPKSSSKNMFKDRGEIELRLGGRSIGIPLELKGLEELWKEHGKMKWKELVEPVIPLARDGFEANPYLLASYAISGYTIMDAVKETFFILDEGTWRMPNLGEVCCKRPALAKTLELLAEKGADELYRSSWGKWLTEDIRDLPFPGIIDKEELIEAKPVIREPIRAKVHGMDVLTVPPPSSAATMVMALKFLETYEDSPDATLTMHRIVEALKHMFAVRSHLGDPGVDNEFMNVDEILKEIFKKSFIEDLRNGTSDKTTQDRSFYGGKYRIDEETASDAGTSHICVADEAGNVVSLTTSVNSGFGSLMLSNRTGVLLNNIMMDFAAPGVIRRKGPHERAPVSENLIQPGRRPLSSMSPTILLKDGRFHMTIGGSGGVYIIAGILQVLHRHLQLGMDIEEAIRHPRINDVLSNHTFYEKSTRGPVTFAVEEDVVNALQKMGHNMLEVNFGGYMSALEFTDNGEFRGIPDPRKDAAAASNL